MSSPTSIPQWMREASETARKRLESAGIGLTLGGEPTFVPLKPTGPEWSFAAVGPTKLSFAKAAAKHLLDGPLRGGVAFFCPGKLYPGEVNPRWAIKILTNRDGTPLRKPVPRPPRGVRSDLNAYAAAICKKLGVPARWQEFQDPQHPGSHVLAMPLDHDGTTWASASWPLPKKLRQLLPAEGPAGLRLPLQHFPEKIPKRVLTLEWRGPASSVFFPPLLQGAFLELLEAVETAAPLCPEPVELEGYVPQDTDALWSVLGLAADPGVLEINLPACSCWEDYAGWLEMVTTACEAAGLRSWKEPKGDFPEGTGGGNHILWGGATTETNPFFTRPGWLAAILRHWQQHPSLAYLFTGCYVGASSQAPRPDESARDLYDLEMAYQFLESLPPGDHRQLINETLRHLHTDVTGNSHRSEISFDKFWNTAWPGGSLGLIEFRAFESLPQASWMAGTALLLYCLAARALSAGKPKPLRSFGKSLHDKFFLPTVLWNDLRAVLNDLAHHGLALDEAFFKEIWDWRFPVFLDWEHGNSKLSVRKALEGWPLLCETPIEGGSTSRFVDTSIHRLEFTATPEFAENHDIFVAGRHLPLHEVNGLPPLAGLRYRRTNLYPSLHPGIPPHMPLTVSILNKETHRIAAAYTLLPGHASFQQIPVKQAAKLAGPACVPHAKTELTYDLRL